MSTQLTFQQRHPWVVYDANGEYDSRFTGEKIAREHAVEIGGTVEIDPPPSAHPAIRA